MKRTTRLVSLLVAASMAFGLCPVSVFAADAGGGIYNDPDAVTAQTLEEQNDDSVVTVIPVSDVTSFQDAVRQINAASGEEFVISLQADIVEAPPITFTNGQTTIQGNNHTIQCQNLQSSSFIEVQNNATLSLVDVTICPDNLADGGQLISLTGATLEMKGNSCLDGRNRTTCVISTSSTNQSNINMSGNSQIKNGYDQYRGGAGINLSATGGGTLTMTDSSSITNCSTNSNGGGVNLMSATLAMSGSSSIKDCRAAMEGGGVNLMSATLAMSDSSSITGCFASMNGGGVAVSNSNSSLIMEDRSVICNNVASSSDSDYDYSSGSDLYLYNCTSITLRSALSMNQQYGTSGYLIDGWYLDNQGSRCTVPAGTDALDITTIPSLVQTHSNCIGLVACYGQNPTPVPSGDDDDAASGSSSGSGDGGAGAIVAGALIGGAAYLVGTGLWMKANLPGGVIPTSREQLALMLWNAAGRPEPQPAALYGDIDAANTDTQQAARWCVQQGLMKDYSDGSAFRPGRYTFRPQVITAWNKQQKLPKAE